MLLSVRDEITLTISHFDSGSGQHLREGKQGTPHNWTVPVSAEPFPIFLCYVSSIGKIKNEELRRLIITGYGKAQAVVGTLRFNNILLERHEHAAYLAARMNDELHHAMAKDTFRRLCVYGDNLRTVYAEAMQATEMLTAALNRELEANCIHAGMPPKIGRARCIKK